MGAVRGTIRWARAAVAVGTVALCASAFLSTVASAAPSADAGATVHVGGMVPVHGSHVRSAAVAPAAANLAYHGGKVMQQKEVSYAIFWNPPKLQNGDASHMSATYQTLIRRYFGDVGGNGLYNASTQYYQKKGTTQQNILNVSKFGGVWVDTSAYPASGCSDSATPGNCVSDAQIQAEVSKAMTAKGWTGGLSHMFFVFTSYGEGSCAGSSCAFTAYCAYHSYFTAGTQKVIYANMPYTGTLLGGCGVSQSPNADFDADSTINVTSHEEMEAVTDPLLNAWYDASGEEIGDKCAWNFGPLSFGGGTANESWNGHLYLLQQEWSNDGSKCVQTYP